MLRTGQSLHAEVRNALLPSPAQTPQGHASRAVSVAASATRTRTRDAVLTKQPGPASKPVDYVYNTAQAPSSEQLPLNGSTTLHVSVGGKLVVGTYLEVPRLSNSFTHVLHVGPGDPRAGFEPAARDGLPTNVKYRALPLDPRLGSKEIFHQLDACVAHLRRTSAARWTPDTHTESIFVCCSPGGSCAAAVAVAHQMEASDAPLHDLLEGRAIKQLINGTTDGLFASVWVKVLTGWNSWRRQTNLLQETLQVMADNGKKVADVEYVILKSPQPGGALGEAEATEGSSCSFSSFARLAGHLRYATYDLNKISPDLMICGHDWWMTRGEYGGFEEWWEFHTRPSQPPAVRDCTVRDILTADWTPETAAKPELRWHAWVKEGHVAPQRAVPTGVEAPRRLRGATATTKGARSGSNSSGSSSDSDSDGSGRGSGRGGSRGGRGGPVADNAWLLEEVDDDEYDDEDAPPHGGVEEAEWVALCGDGEDLCGDGMEE